MSKQGAEASQIFILVAVIITAFCSQGSAQNVSWQFERSLLEQYMAYPALIETHSDKMAADAKHGSLQQLIFQVGESISQGLVYSTTAERSIATKASGLVELPVVVASSIDDHFSTRDNYWSYYEDCDRWGVSFGIEKVEVLYLPEAPVKKTPSSSALQTVINRVKMLEFKMYENADQFSGLIAWAQENIEPAEESTNLDASNPQIITKLLGHYVENRPLLRALKMLKEFGDVQIETMTQLISETTDGFLTVTREQISTLKSRANQLF